MVITRRCLYMRAMHLVVKIAYAFGSTDALWMLAVVQPLPMWL